MIWGGDKATNLEGPGGACSKGMQICSPRNSSRDSPEGVSLTFLPSIPLSLSARRPIEPSPPRRCL